MIFQPLFFFLIKCFLRISKCLLIVKHVKYWCLVRTGKIYFEGADGTYGVKMMWLICFLYHVHKVMYKWPEKANERYPGGHLHLDVNFLSRKAIFLLFCFYTDLGPNAGC